MPQTPLFTSQGYNYKHMTGTTTTVVKAAAGVLRRLTVNTATAGAVVTLYDNTAGSGTVIAVLTYVATLNAPASLLYDGLTFNTGLTIVTTTQSADITVLYS